MATFNLTNNYTIFLFSFTHEDLQKGAQDKKWVYMIRQKRIKALPFFFLALEQSVIVSVP